MAKTWKPMIRSTASYGDGDCYYHYISLWCIRCLLCVQWSISLLLFSIFDSNAKQCGEPSKLCDWNTSTFFWWVLFYLHSFSFNVWREKNAGNLCCSFRSVFVVVIFVGLISSHWCKFMDFSFNALIFTTLVSDCLTTILYFVIHWAEQTWTSIKTRV